MLAYASVIISICKLLRKVGLELRPEMRRRNIAYAKYEDCTCNLIGAPTNLHMLRSNRPQCEWGGQLAGVENAQDHSEGRAASPC